MTNRKHAAACIGLLNEPCGAILVGEVSRNLCPACYRKLLERVRAWKPQNPCRPRGGINQGART